MKIYRRPITSAFDFNDKPFAVVTRFYSNDGTYSDYEEIVNAMNERTARAIVDSVYKSKDHEIIDIHIASIEDQHRLANQVK